MKKYVLMSAVGMMMLAACSDDESVAMDKQDPSVPCPKSHCL